MISVSCLLEDLPKTNSKSPTILSYALNKFRWKLFIKSIEEPFQGGAKWVIYKVQTP
jgi:hypothetical protein